MKPKTKNKLADFIYGVTCFLIITLGIATVVAACGDYIIPLSVKIGGLLFGVVWCLILLTVWCVSVSILATTCKKISVVST